MYTLKFPFALPPGREIEITEESGELDGLTFSLKKQDCKNMGNVPISYLDKIKHAFIYILVIWVVILMPAIVFSGEKEGQRKGADGFFWVTLSADAKHAWLNGYAASSAVALVWAQNSNIPDELIKNLMSTQMIHDIAGMGRDIRLIAKHIDNIYSSKEYYSIDLVSALGIVKDKLIRSDNYWEFEREFLSLPEEMQEEFGQKFGFKYSGSIEERNYKELIRKLNEFRQNRKK